MDAAYREIESKIINHLIERIGDDRFDLWFEGDNSFRFDGNLLTVQSAEYFAQNRIMQSFSDDLRQISRSVIGRPVNLDFQLVSRELLTADSSKPSHDHPKVQRKPDNAHRLPETSTNSTGNSRTEAASLHPSEPRGDSNHQSVSSSDPKLLKFPEPATTKSKPTQQSTSQPPNLRGQENSQTLEHFRFGDNNALLRSAVTQTVNQPGQFSPLYFFGPVGSGKTHLLRGIITAYRQQRRMSRCIYMTAEQFTSNFIEAIDGRGVSDFRRKCRGLEALAIDDVQFFGGKRATLVEFQSTIESLIRDGKQIILAGDCSLAELRCFEPELINRIAGGLPCPVGYPNESSRYAILKKLIADRGMTVPEATVEYLAQHLERDVRHLSGALNRLQAAEMSGMECQNIEQVHNLILDLIQASRCSVSIREIESAVGEFCGIEIREMRSNSRSKQTSTARMLAMFLSRRLTGFAYSEIGRHFGGRSHSTVISANNKIRTWLERNHFISVNHTQCSVNEVLDQIESKLKRG